MVFTDKELGDIQIEKKKISKNLRIRIDKKGNIMVSIPVFVSYKKAIAFINKNIEWIKKTREKLKATQIARTNLIKNNLIGSEYINENKIEVLRPIAKKILISRLNEINKELGFKINRVVVKNNKSNWGSCSSKGNINLNMHLIRLPNHLMNFIIVHELCHIRHPNHGRDFHNLLNQLIGGKEKEYSKELKIYSQLLSETI